MFQNTFHLTVTGQYSRWGLTKRFITAGKFNLRICSPTQTFYICVYIGCIYLTYMYIQGAYIGCITYMYIQRICIYSGPPCRYRYIHICVHAYIHVYKDAYIYIYIYALTRHQWQFENYPLKNGKIYCGMQILRINLYIKLEVFTS